MSIVSRNLQKTPAWRFRLNEVQEASKADREMLARHHYVMLLSECIADARCALRDQDAAAKRAACTANDVDRVERSLVFMDRFQSLALAVAFLDCGKSFTTFEWLELLIWGQLALADQGVEDWRRLSKAERRRTSLAFVLGPVLERVEELIERYFEVATISCELEHPVVYRQELTRPRTEGDPDGRPGEADFVLPKAICVSPH